MLGAWLVSMAPSSGVTRDEGMRATLHAAASMTGSDSSERGSPWGANSRANRGNSPGSASVPSAIMARVRSSGSAVPVA